MNREIRYYDFSKKENRAYAPHISDENSRVVEGYAIVFNQASRMLQDKTSKKVFTEIIDPRAVTKLFLDEQDIKMLYNHDDNALLARSVWGAGTLSYEVDDYGVKYRFEMPNTSVGNDVLELIKRGDIWGCSFAFAYSKDGIRDEKRNGENIRTVISMARIDDFSIVVNPAYWGTYVTTREFVAPDPEPTIDHAGLMDVEQGLFELETMNL